MSRLEEDLRPNGAVRAMLTGNEMLYSLHDGERQAVHDVRRPFQREPDSRVMSVNCGFADLLARAETPR